MRDEDAPAQCRRPFWRITTTALFLLGILLCPFRGELAGAAEAVTPVNNDRKLAPHELAAWIDAQFDAEWARLGIRPADRTDDSEFVRRVHLDLIGRIPSVAEGRAFLTETRPAKRQVLVQELMQRGAFAAHLANTWRDLLLAGNTAIDVRTQARALETWLKLRFSANMPYDQLASELLTATLEQNNPRTPSPLAFYQAAEFKPELLASSVSKVFLGVQVQCAQCHDHPFTQWKQPQFWSFAALFKNLDQPRGANMMQAESADGDSILIPGKEVLVPALFLDGSKPESTGRDRRTTLARWITSPDNPYFAKAVVNRVWGSFFGRGFVQPIDDLDPVNPAVFPHVFDEICVQFRLHNCDLKYLINVITETRAYQLSSRGGPAEGDDGLTQQFARMPLRRMTSDQVYASFVQATTFREPVINRGNVVIPNNAARDEFQSKFADSSVSPTEVETTILQALSLMNGRYVADASNLEKSEFLSAVADSPFFDDATRVETLFLATLSRLPKPDELNLFLDDNQSTGDPAVRKAALADAFWILLNSAEFLLNH